MSATPTVIARKLKIAKNIVAMAVEAVLVALLPTVALSPRKVYIVSL